MLLIQLKNQVELYQFELKFHQYKFDWLNINFQVQHQAFLLLILLVKMILRRYDNSIDRASAEEHAIPVFWIDMSLLYEHYAIARGVCVGS